MTTWTEHQVIKGNEGNYNSIFLIHDWVSPTKEFWRNFIQVHKQKIFESCQKSVNCKRSLDDEKFVKWNIKWYIIVNPSEQLRTSLWSMYILGMISYKIYIMFMQNIVNSICQYSICFLAQCPSFMFYLKAYTSNISTRHTFYTLYYFYI